MIPRDVVLFELAYNHLAETTAYGLVLHPTVDPRRKECGFWDCSDPETGLRVAEGAFVGRLGAVAALVQIARLYKDYPGGFRARLQSSREQVKAGFINRLFTRRVERLPLPGGAS